MHESSMLNMRHFIDNYLKDAKDIKIADIGSQTVEGGGSSSYKTLFNKDTWRYFGVDMEEGKNVDIALKNPYSYNEIKTNSFDAVVSGQALEHVEYIWVTILEMTRILKPGGLLCIVAPSSGYAHLYPLDCWRFFDDGLKALAKFARLEVLEAFTQRDRFERGYFDPIWQDSVLIARKPHRGLASRIKFTLANKASRVMVKNLAPPKPCGITMDTQLFYSAGGGFSEEHSFRKYVTVQNNCFKVLFDLPENTKNLRFDPANFPVKAKITAHVRYKGGGGQNIDIQGTNGKLDAEGYMVFNHDDPVYLLDCEDIGIALVDYVCFEGEVVKLAQE